MKLVRRLASTHRIVGIAGLSLAALTLGISVASWADESAPAAGEPSAVALSAAPTTEATVKPPAPDADSPKPSHHRPVKRLTAAQRIDENVRRLTRGLDLDPSQQEQFRQILVDQHRHIMALRSSQSTAPVDAAGASLAIYDQTKARIRAMLNDEQRKKYSVEVPRDELAPAQADLQHWMQLQDSKRMQDAEAPK